MEKEYSKSVAWVSQRETYLKCQQDKLVDMRLSRSISEDLFLEKNNKIENELFEVIEKKQSMKLPEMRAKAQKVIELAGCLYKAYQRANDKLKAMIIKSNVIELSVTSKKELLIRESPLMQCSKIVNFAYGTPGWVDD